MNDCISIYIQIYAYTGISICVICMYRLEYMYQCIRINPTVKYMYHVYVYTVYTLLFQLPHAQPTLAKCYRMRRIR
jgi:hypothetical protein